MSHYTEFKAHQTSIVAISFGKPDWAQIWLKAVAAPFPIWLDAERRAYRAYGLEKSMFRSWGLNNLRYYARALLAGQKLQGYQGDVNQLGGNVIVDRQGIVRFSYPSRDPTDRPSIAALLGVLQQLT